MKNAFLETHQTIMSEFVCSHLNIDEVNFFQLAGDASSRKYFRAENDGQTWVLMCWEPFDIGDFPFLNIQNHFRENNVLVPEVLALSPKTGMVLLEDLGDLTLERKFWENQDQQVAMPFYKKTIDELIKINFTSTANKNLDCSAFQIEFDIDKFMWEFNFAKSHFFEKFCGLDITEKDSKTLQSEFLTVCEALYQEPKWVCHRDFHSRNVMIRFGKTYIIDFQDARLGPMTYDISSLIYDSYVSLSDENKEKLVLYYLKLAKPSWSESYSEEQFFSSLETQTIQRTLKACGSFASFFNDRGDKRYLKYLRPAMKNIADNLKSRSDLPLLKSIIDDIDLPELSRA